MNKAFSSFQESALASSIKEMSPILAQDLRTVAARFNDLSQNLTLGGTSDGSHPRPDLSARVYNLEEPTEDSQIAQDIVGRNRVDTYNTRTRLTHKPKAATQAWGYELDEGTQVEQEEMQNPQPSMVDYGSLDVSNDLDWFAQNTTLYHAQIPDTQSGTQSMIPYLNTSLAPPSTYSFQEATFARRLARAAYERAYRVMTNPNSRKEDIHTMCKFTFCFSSAKSITNFVKSIHAKGKNESIEMWQANQLHLGGAGLHYPRQLESHVPSYWANKAPMGPRRSMMAETPVPDWMTVEQIIEITGFQGEWFDPNDVEQYLRSKGLQLDAQSTWLELDVNEIPSLETTQLNGPTSPAESFPDIEPSSPGNTEPRYSGEPVVHVAENSSSLGLADASYVDLNLSFTDPLAKTKSISSDLAYATASLMGHGIPKKVVDVEKFIDSEYSHSIYYCVV